MTTLDHWQQNFVSAGQVRYFSLGRYALIEALNLAGVKQGGRVLLPAFLCRDLMASLNYLGAVPCWYDLTSDLKPLAPFVEWPKAEAVLIVNYFGFAQNLEPFRAYAKLHGATLIEDNAHGLLSRDQNGLWLGCRTGLGIFSMRKTLRMPDGAALWVDASYTAQRIPAQLEFNGTGFNPAELSKARLRGLPWIGGLAFQFFTYLARKFRKWRTGSHIPASELYTDKFLPALPNPWAGLWGALVSCNEEKEIQRRRAAFLSCSKVGECFGAIPVFDKLPSECVPYGYAFRGDTAVVVAMSKYAKKIGFDLVKWPELPEEIAKKCPAHYRDILIVNFLW